MFFYSSGMLPQIPAAEPDKIVSENKE